MYFVAVFSRATEFRYLTAEMAIFAAVTIFRSRSGKAELRQMKNPGFVVRFLCKTQRDAPEPGRAEPLAMPPAVSFNGHDKGPNDCPVYADNVHRIRPSQK